MSTATARGDVPPALALLTPYLLANDLSLVSAHEAGWQETLEDLPPSLECDEEASDTNDRA